MTWTHGDIDSTAFVFHVDDGDIHVTGKIDHYSTAILITNGGSITIDGKVDNNSNVSLTATGDITIGGEAIDGGSTVVGSSGGSITIGGKLDGSSRVSFMASGDIHLEGKVDDNSIADMTSHQGSITIDGKVDNNSKVTLIADGDVSIGTVGGGGDKKIDGNSHVDATSGGTIALGNKIDSGNASVDFKACEAITIGDKIDGGSTVRLWSGGATIDVAGKIDNSSTHVTFWPPGSLNVAGSIQGGAQVSPQEWALVGPLCSSLPEVKGYWWQNWPQTFGYVSPLRAFPRSLQEISAAVAGGTPERGRIRALKAVGGGWSFTDASLPFQTQPEVDQVSTALRGASGTQDFHNVLQGIGNSTNSPIDLWPQAVDAAVSFSTDYEQPSMTQQTTSGAVLPGSGNVQLIDIGALASSLQCELHGILSDSAKSRPKDGTFLFHVEAGITMADLDQLLDHQNPRMAIQASGGSPGATLAGTISTATHGGEFAWPLLVDRVRAIHLVGPGGEEWWIEGGESIADPAKLHARYPKLDAAHFIGGSWAGIPGLTAQDALNAVIVSMGTMGVIYSVVLEVVAQFGLQQIVTATNWSALLAAAGTTEARLRAGDSAANRAVLQVMLDGTRNGTGIAMADNVYADLAINPFNQDCWVTNRQVTPLLPVDANSPATSIGDYLGALNVPLSTNAVDNVTGNHLLGRIFDFLGWATDIPANVDDLANDVTQALAIVNFLTRYPDLLSAPLATINVQAVANVVNNSSHPDRGQQFLGDVLGGFLGALQGTANGLNSNRTGIAYQVGAIGWPAGGLPGRGIEIALTPERAFTFLQAVLFDDVLQNTMVAGNMPLIGYISIRICPPTKTLMGMQQYEPFSVMLEVVGYRSPEADFVMDLVQQKVLQQNQENRLQALLHWGLENQQLTAADLLFTPLQDTIGSTSTTSKLDAFRQVRQYIRNGNAPVFDNNFVRRLGL